MIRITGKRYPLESLFVYGTTRQFLEYFGLNSLDDLPKVEEFTKASAQASTLLSLSNHGIYWPKGSLF